MMHDLSDEKLYLLCREYGEKARFWRQKFIGLLPEVYQRRLYERKGFSSIFEFAKKLAGLSEEQVRRVLHLEEKYRAMPVLHGMLVNGEASVNKLARVVNVVTQENEDFWANQVQLLPQKALEILVKDEKSVRAHDESETILTLLQVADVPEPHLSNELKQRLAELEQKGININTLLTQFLDQRDAEIASEKEQLAEQYEPRHGRGTTRYIPVKIRNIMTKKHGTACSIASCTKPARVIHHTQRFAITRNHDPRYLAPLCHEHHQIAHSIDLKYQEKQRTLHIA